MQEHADYEDNVILSYVLLIVSKDQPQSCLEELLGSLEVQNEECEIHLSLPFLITVANCHRQMAKHPSKWSQTVDATQFSKEYVTSVCK